MPAVLVFGIKFGFATPTEVSAVAVLYGLILGVVVYRSLGLAEIFKILVDAGLLTGLVLFIVAAASAFAWTLTAADLPHLLLASLDLIGNSPVSFMIGAIVLMIVVGSLVEGLPAIIILAPLLTPIAIRLGIDQIHFSMVLILAMGVGVFVPPVGVGFYVACSVAQSDIEGASKAMLPYLTVLLAGILAVAFIPWFTHFIPSLVGP
jgi:tripartite ATP-independent transporter DctM subunit